MYDITFSKAICFQIAVVLNVKPQSNLIGLMQMAHSSVELLLDHSLFLDILILFM